MFRDDIEDDSSTSSTPTANTHTSLSASELEQFRSWRDNKLMEQGIAQGRAMASAEHAAAEEAADRAALEALTRRGVSLKDAFGNSTSVRGRDTLIQLSRSSFGRSGGYGRLRRLAREAGLVK